MCSRDCAASDVRRPWRPDKRSCIVHRSPMPPLMGFTLRSFFLPLGPTRCRVRDESRATRRILVRRRRLPTCRLRLCRPTRQIAVSHLRRGFWAFISLGIRRSPAVLGPRMIRCSPGFLPPQGFRPPLLEPVFTGLPLTVLRRRSLRRAAVPSAVFRREDQLSLATVIDCIEPSVRDAALGSFCVRVSA